MLNANGAALRFRERLLCTLVFLQLVQLAQWLLSKCNLGPRFGIQQLIRQKHYPQVDHELPMCLQLSTCFSFSSVPSCVVWMLSACDCCRARFWVDFAAWFPFDWIVLWSFDAAKADHFHRWLGLLTLLRMVPCLSPPPLPAPPKPNPMGRSLKLQFSLLPHHLFCIYSRSVAPCTV